MYASLADMVERYGEVELLRLSVIDGPTPEDIADLRVEARVSRAIATAGDIVDSYLRKRYSTPLATPPASIVEATCVLARHWLSTSGSVNPSDSVTTAVAQTRAWLGRIATGDVTIEGLAPVAQSAAARVSDRPKIYEPGAGGMW
ncbi:MAG: DUF1320 domain-containing protein [Salinarimonadaceae bacterium]|nr:MAG: DUF1320 domain-containing protein [Salinarimonadaceae bacterium]